MKNPNDETSQHIVILRNLIEESVGRKIKTPTDFSFLTGVIMERTKEMLSVTTLKRIWGYIDGYDTTRYATLSILARCVGYKDWESFEQNYCNSDQESSKLLFGESLNVQDLAEGTLIRIAWNPDRECLLRVLGKGNFEVLESVNSKLKANDTFHCSLMILNQPLYIDNLVQANHESALFVVGNKGGLTKIEVVRC